MAGGFAEGAPGRGLVDQCGTDRCGPPPVGLAATPKQALEHLVDELDQVNGKTGGDDLELP